MSILYREGSSQKGTFLHASDISKGRAFTILL